MAEQQYDGSIKIGTGLDTSGFEQGSKKMQQAIAGTARAVDQLGKKAADAMSTPIKVPDVEMPEGLDGTVEPNLDSEQFDKAASRMRLQINRIIGEIDRMISTSQQGFRNTTAVLSYNDKLQQTSDRIADARAELEAFADQQIPTDAYAYVSKQIEATEKQLLKLYDRQDQMQDLGVDESSKAWQKLQYQIQQTEGLLESYEMTADEMRETGRAFVDPQATEQYRQMTEQIQLSENALQANAAVIRQEQLEQARLNVLAAQEKVAAAETNRERNKVLAELQSAQNQLAAIAQKAVTPAPDPTAANGWVKFGNSLKECGKEAVNLAKKLGAGALKGVSGIFNGAISGAKNLLSHFKKSGSGIDGLTKKLTGLKTMLVSRIKRTFINFLFQSIQESFKALAQFDSRFDQSVSNLRNRTKELGANIMGAFGGLIRQVEPYITAFIDRMSQAVVKVSAMLAALRGESTVQVAKRQTDSYAASLDSAAESAQDAKKAQDKLNATLTSYDEIHKLSEDKAAEDATSQATPNPGEALYQNVPVEAVFSGIDDSVKGLVDQLKTAIKQGDWRGVGETVAEGLNLAVGKLDDAILKAHDKAIKLTEAVAEGLNGLTDKLNTYSIGKTVGDAINLGLDTAYTFLTTYDFGKFGQRVAEGFNGLMDTVDAPLLGQTLAAGLNAIIDFGYSALTTFDFRKFGTKLGESINGFVKNVDWAKVARTLSAGIRGALDTISSTIEEVDWAAVGEKLVDFLTNLDYAGIAKSIAEGIGAAIGGIGAFFKGIFSRLAETGEKWGEHLFDVFSGEIETAGGNVADGVWNGIKSAFKDTAKKVKETILDPFIKGFKKAFGIASPAKEMKPYGEFVGEGVLEGVKGVFSSLTGWASEHLVEPFKRGFTSAFNVVGDKAQTLVASGKSIANGISSGIKTGWSVVTGVLEEKRDDFLTAGAGFVSNLSSGISSTWHVVTDVIGSNLGNMSFDTSGLRSVGEQLIDGMKNGVTGPKWDGMVGRIWERFDDLTRWFNNEGRESFRTSGEYMIDGLDEGMREKFSITLETVHNGGQAAVDAFNRAVGISSPSKKMAESGRYFMQGLTEGIEGESKRTYQSVRVMAQNVMDEAEITPEVNTATSGLDAVAEKLTTIAEIFESIRQTFRDFTTLPVPALVSGNFAPARTTPGDGDSGDIKQMIQRFLDKAEELEERIANRPIRVDSHVEIDKREVGKAVTEYKQSNGNINNGNGGRW